MAAKMNTTKKIPLASGSKSSGKTVPGPNSVRGGGTGAGGPSGKMQNVGGSGYGRASGVNKRGSKC